jgi:hypothetical protein
MAIIKKDTTKKIVVDLTGPQGNAYWLMGYASSLCKQLKWDSKPILDDMKSGDYENLIKVFDKNFGSVVDLER